MTDDFVVYKISSDLTHYTYYGYCLGDPLESFLRGAHQTMVPGKTRGTRDWVHSNQGKTDNIEVEIVDVCIDEVEAWSRRNDERSTDTCAITGPSQWPYAMSKMMQDKDPERVQQWKKNMDLRKCTNVRQAMQMGALSFQQMKQLTEQHDRNIIVKDMDSMDPFSFCAKYSIEFLSSFKHANTTN